MEKPNTDTSSETSTAPSLTDGYKKALLLKEAQIRLAGSKWDTHIFKRFYETPHVLSNVLATLLLSALLLLTYEVPLPIWLKVGWFFIGLIVSAWMKMEAYLRMSKSRIRAWGNGKFETWADFDSWLKKTTGIEWEALVDCPYPWIPDQTNGGGIIIEDPAYL